MTSDRAQALINPVLLVEVLSPTTSGYDYSRKFDLYRTIESFREYLLVFQDEPRADLFSRQDDGSRVLRVYMGLDAVVPVPSLNLSLTLGEIYTDVPFTEPETDRPSGPR